MCVAFAEEYVDRCVVLVFDESEGAAGQLEQDDVAVAALCGLREMSQHVGCVSL